MRGNTVLNVLKFATNENWALVCNDKTLQPSDLEYLGNLINAVKAKYPSEESGRDKTSTVDILKILRVKETVVQKVYQRRYTGLGHGWRINNERIVNFALEGKMEDKQRVGKPKISWLRTALKRSELNFEEAIETVKKQLRTTINS